MRMPFDRGRAVPARMAIPVAALPAVAAALFLLAAPPCWSQKDGRGNAIVPNPDPFSLSACDAASAVALIERARFLQLWGGSGMPETVAVEEAKAVYIGTDEEAVPARRNRYDILVNGEPVDWRNTYVEYDGRMVNLRLLFTYRNQHPPPGLRYFIPADLPGE
ncbi:MAG: hypothetical protein ACOCYG_07670 [Spirochaetota bacterium]